MTDPRTIPTEQLLQQTDDPNRPGIYTLSLDNPGSSLHAHARRWYREFETVHPDDVGGLVGTEQLLYIGAAANLQSRLEDHVQAMVRRSTWMSVYPPVELRYVSLSPTVHSAFERESRAAFTIADETPETTTVICDGEVIG
jgi:hypothetical protein